MKAPNKLLAPLAAENSWNVSTKSYQTYAEQVFHLVQKWPPAYIPFSSPMIGGMVLGPAAMFFRVALDRDRENENQLGMECEMLKLCLTHIARFWKIGSVFLGKSSSFVAIHLDADQLQKLQHRCHHSDFTESISCDCLTNFPRSACRSARSSACQSRACRYESRDRWAST
jgi:hypothetical protein